MINNRNLLRYVLGFKITSFNSFNIVLPKSRSLGHSHGSEWRCGVVWWCGVVWCGGGGVVWCGGVLDSESLIENRRGG